MNASSGIDRLISTGVSIRNFKTVDFVAANNGTILLPTTESAVEGGGYVLAPGASETFTFSGVIVLDNGHIAMTTMPEATYKVVLDGEYGTLSTINVTTGLI